MDTDAFGDESQVWSELGASTNAAVEVVYRNGVRSTPELLLVTNPSISAVPNGKFSPDGSFVITGGLGALGLITAEVLADLGAHCIVLVSRSGRVSYSGQGLEDRLEGLQKLTGTDVKVMQCDVSQEDSVTALLSKVRALGHPIRGIVHAAGVLSDGMLAKQNAATLAEVMIPKSLGAWYLHKHTRADDIKLFLLFSSVASLFGNPGQANYSAANSYLDGLASWRRTQNLAATSIQWPAVSGVGMAAAMDGDGKSLANFSIPPEQVAAALQHLILDSADSTLSGPAQAVLPLSMLGDDRSPHWLKQFVDRVSIKREPERGAKTTATTAGAVAPAAAEGGAFAQELRGLTSEEQLIRVSDLVMGIVQRVMGEEVASNANLQDEGLTSLDATELVNMLNEQLEVELPPTILMDHNTVDSLAGYLATFLTSQGGAAQDLAPSKPSYQNIAYTPSTPTSTVTESAQNVCNVLGTNRKMRVLCLHGFAADAQIASQLLELQGWTSRLSGVDFVYPDGLHRTAALPEFEPYRPLTESGVYDKDHYKWWATFSISKQIAKHAKEFTKSQGSEAASSSDQWPEQWSQTTEYMKEIIDRFGPFDGIMGISEGAIVAQWVASMHSNKRVDFGPCARFKFVISVVGPPPDLDFTCSMKSLHLLGRDDSIFDKGELLPEIKNQFPESQTVVFSGGHTVPPMTSDLAATLTSFIDSAKDI
jgi:NAD(P)-dependent dehydrogenase (short-subunit alcohol dehydrogenase family)/acyl carrier protein